MGRTRASVCLLLYLCAAVLPAAVAAQPANPAAAGILRFDRAVILDPNGFEAPMAASTMFVPHGWTVGGGVLWGQQHMCTNGYNFDWSATSPDGWSQIAILPQVGWEMNNYGAPPSKPGCLAAAYSDVASYLQAAVQNWRPGARVLDFRRRPDIERELGNVNSSTPMPMGELRTWAEAGEVLFGYTDRGVDMRGSVAAAVVFTYSRTDAGLGTGSMDALFGMAYPAFGVVAPNGSLDLGFYDALRRTIALNPQWQQRIAGHNNTMSRISLDGARKRSEIIRESNAEISRIREEAWNSYQKSSDYRAREFGEYIREVETYADPDAPGGTVELSHHYEDAWRLNDGSYVLSNDTNFDPWKDLGVEGQKLEAAP